MKNFFAIKYFKELKTLFVLELMMIFMISLLISVNKAEIQYFSLPAFCITIGIWILCSIIDKPKYFNLATLLSTSFVTYFVFWFMFYMIK